MAEALDGLKILDFSWVVAAPLATKTLAEHGATVVRVESLRHPDIARSYLLYSNGPGINRCSFFASVNNDKYGLQLDLANPKARPLIERLVRWADIVVENFTPGTLEELGLGFDQLREINPQTILLRTSLFGQTGPYARQLGFGMMMMALAGFTSLVGWPDRRPVGTQVPYTDYVAPWYVVSLAIAAIEYRRRTGQGQCIDLSQLEAGTHFMIPTLLGAEANHRIAPLAGNRVPGAAPHGVFQCQGDDRWCAIAVFDDAQWDGLCRAMGNPGWTAQERFSTLLGRKEHEDELEASIGVWTASMTPDEVMERLQREGVPSGVVANGSDLHADPQLAHRGHYVRLDHAEMGKTAYDAPSFRLSATPSELRRPAPCLGEHTEYVCTQILGLSDEEFLELLNDGVFE